MKIHGYCEKCHKPKRVRVAFGRWQGGVPTGVCDECEEAQNRRPR